MKGICTFKGQRITKKLFVIWVTLISVFSVNARPVRFIHKLSENIFKLLTGAALSATVIFLMLTFPVNASAGKVAHKRKAGVHRRHAFASGKPVISYSSPKNYTTAVAITPLTPASSNVAAYNYGQYLENISTPFVGTATASANGLATDKAGNLYMINGDNSAVDRVMPDGSLVVIATVNDFLQDMAIDAAGNIYTPSPNSGILYKIAAGSNTAVTLASSLNTPSGVAVDAAGNVYFTEGITAGTVKKIAAGTGTITTVATGFVTPQGMAMDDAGNLYVADYGNGAVKEIRFDGGGVTTVIPFGNGYYSPLELAIDHAGTLFVTSFQQGFNNTAIYYKRVDQTQGSLIFEAEASGLAVGNKGELYTSFQTQENEGNSIVQFSPEGGYFLDKALPAGLSFDSTTGKVSGTPMVASAATTYNVTAYLVSNPNNPDSTHTVVSGTASVTIAVNSVPAPAISYSSAQTYIVNVTTNADVTNTGGAVNAVVYHPTASTVGSGFNLPNGVAKDASGNIYIADRGSNTIKKATGRGAAVVASGFNKPTGVAVDAAGNLYVADYGNNAVKKIPAGTTTPVTWGSGFSNPLGIAVDAAGYVYVADKGNNAIKKISPNGTTTVSIGSGFSAPSGVAVDAWGNVYVADTGTGSVKLIPAGNGTVSTIYFGLSNPFGVAVDFGNNIYVANEGDNTVYKLNTTTGPVAVLLGSEFKSPEGICVDSKGNIYIADTGNNEIRLMQPFNGYFINGWLPAGINFNSTTGLLNGTPTAVAPPVNYTVTAYNSGGSNTSSIFSVQVTAATADALLSNLSVSTGTLSPVFANNTTTYAVSVPNSATPITLTPTVFNAQATVTVNGAAVVSGNASAAIPLTVGLNAINTVVTAPDGTTTKTYTVNVTRAASSNAGLVGLVPGTGAISPAFSTATTAYTETVNGSVASIIITPTVADNTATVTVNGTAVTSGTASGAITLNTGTNVINIVVTAQDGATTSTYTLTVTKLSSDAILSSITTNPSIPLIAISGPGYKNYSASVPNTTNTVQIIPVTEDATATVKVNGVVVLSGAASASIPLNAGDNVINTVVTAQDGTVKTYIITITRSPSSNASLGNLIISQGTLSPVFSTSTTSYTVSVANTITSITVTPTVADAATVKVNGTTVPSGSPSGAIALSVGANTITIKLTAQDGSTTKTYTITVTRGTGPSATLSLFKISRGTLTPAFSPNTLNYTANVVNGVTSFTIMPTTSDPNATVKVNGTVIASGTASAAIPLSVGTHNINTKVTSSDGVTTKTYILSITRAPSNNANLSLMKLTSGVLSPVFTAATNTYTATVANGVTSVKLTPTTVNGAATLTVNGTAVASGTASVPIDLNVGPNTITTLVTAQDGVTKRTYTITVTRKASTNDNLLALKLSTGTLSPAFAPATTSYTSTVANTVASVTVTPTTVDENATVTVNGTAVTSGDPSGAIALGVGANAITTVVTAQDGVTKRTYTITVTRGGPINIPDETMSVQQLPGTPQFADNVVVQRGLSPNGDGINDVLKIDNIEAYPDNKLTIMDRNGTLVYEVKSYDNASRVFDGHSNKTGQMQLPGTYFYSLDYTANGVLKHKTGFIVMKY